MSVQLLVRKKHGVATETMLSDSVFTVIVGLKVATDTYTAQFKKILAQSKKRILT